MNSFTQIQSHLKNSKKIFIKNKGALKAPLFIIKNQMIIKVRALTIMPQYL